MNSSFSIGIVSLSANGSISQAEYTPDRIKSLLKRQSTNYQVVLNGKTNLTSTCWKVFGFPAKKSEKNNRFEKIDGFTSCRLCFQTFTYTSTSGTRNMNDHSCVKNLSNAKIIPPTTSPGQMNLNNMLNSYKQIKLDQNELTTVKNLACSWICEDMRPFTIVEDEGLRNLLQEFINLGEIMFPNEVLIDSICFRLRC